MQSYATASLQPVPDALLAGFALAYCNRADPSAGRSGSGSTCKHAIRIPSSHFVLRNARLRKFRVSHNIRFELPLAKIDHDIVQIHR